MAARIAASSSSSPATLTRLASRSTSTDVTPASCSTSAVMATRQWPQLTPGTEYVSCSVFRLIVIVLISRLARQHTPRWYDPHAEFAAVPVRENPDAEHGQEQHE